MTLRCSKCWAFPKLVTRSSNISLALLLFGGIGAAWLLQAAPTPAPGANACPQASARLPAELKPPSLSGGKAVRMLPATVSDLVVGGRGRYLVLSLAQARKLAVFDVTARRVVRYLTMPENEVAFAAGMEKLFIALPERGVLERWNLNTLEREVTVALPFPGKVKALYMGSASAGPLPVP